MAWAKNGTPNTLTTAGDVLSISDMTALKFNQCMYHTLNSGAIKDTLSIDGLGGTTYSERRSENGGTDSTTVSQPDIDLSGNDSSDHFAIIYSINIAAEEKLFITSEVTRSTAGSGTAPQRNEVVGKQSGTSTAYTQFDIDNIGSGSYDTDSNLSVLGTD